MKADLGRECFISYAGEIGVIVGTIKHDAVSLKTWMVDHPEKVELLLAPGAAYTRYEPLGVVAIIGSWNAPIITCLRPLVQAICAGNTCIVKPSEHSPVTSGVIKKLIDEHMDNDFFTCLQGGIDVASTINKLPVDLICFTGSTQVGKIIAKVAAERLTPCILELGGKCPLVIDHTVNIDFAASKVAYGKTVNSGQICIAPDYVFVHESKVKEFVEQIQVKLKQMYGEGKPEGSEWQGKMINDFHTERVEKLIKGAGGTLVCGGDVNKKIKHIEPTVILQPDLDSDLMKEEIFGPVLPVFTFKDIREVIKFINDRDKPLAVYFMGLSTSANSQLLCSQTSSGAYVANELIMHINSCAMGFGGIGMSGQGRHGGFTGFKCFSNEKSILLKNPTPPFLTKLMTPPYGPKM